MNLNGFNKIDEFIVWYIWSLFCLYVVVLIIFLEVVLFGLIFVSYWIKELNLNILNFCCNVLKIEDERKKIIKDMIEGVFVLVCLFCFNV